MYPLKPLLIFSLIICSTPSFASHWQDLWSRPDEQGIQLLKAGKAKEAAKRFQDPEWKSVAHYRAREFEPSLKELDKLHTARSYYNRGNTLARLGQFQDAIASYEHSLQINPNSDDAKYNRDLLKKLLQKKPPKQSQQQKQSNKNKNKNKKKSEKNSADKKSKAQEKPKQEPSDRQKKTTQAKRKQSKQRQAMNKWLRRIPDDPGGLLRQKFMREHLRLQRKRGS